MPQFQGLSTRIGLIIRCFGDAARICVQHMRNEFRDNRPHCATACCRSESWILASASPRTLTSLENETAGPPEYHNEFWRKPGRRTICAWMTKQKAETWKTVAAGAEGFASAADRSGSGRSSLRWRHQSDDDHQRRTSVARQRAATAGRAKQCAPGQRLWRSVRAARARQYGAHVAEHLSDAVSSGLSGAQACDVFGPHADCLRHGRGGDGAVLLPRRSQGVYRFVVLSRIARPLRRGR